MLGFRRKNSEAKRSGPEQDFNEQDLNETKSNRLEEALELTLAEVRELRAEMTQFRKELTGANDLEHVGEYSSESWMEELPIEELPIEELPVKEVIVEEIVAEEQSETVVAVIDPLPSELEFQVEQASEEINSTGESELAVEGWATVEYHSADYKSVGRRRWWQFWRRKKEKPGAGSVDFA